MHRHLISFSLLTALALAADSNEEFRFSTSSDVIAQQPRAASNITTIRSEGLAYLNELRQIAGMTNYVQNTLLDSSAQNHADYLKVNNYSGGHGESSSDTGYTGATPSDRAAYVGYKSGAGENLTWSSSGQTVQSSIDNLFSAIYHRLGFLNSSYDEIGIGVSDEETHHVFNMGNSLLNDACSGESYSGFGSYVYYVCSDSDFRIETGEYETIQNSQKASNPALILWPAVDQTEIPPAFFEESPDPLPDYSVSGYPISLQFSDYHYSSVSLNSLQLFDSDGNEITNVRLLDADSDPNSQFDSTEFTLFPLERLEWGSRYSVEAIYVVDGVQEERAWSFTTATPGYPYYVVENSGTTFPVVSGGTYAFYTPPQDGDDSGSGWSGSYQYGFSFDDSGFVDGNTPYFSISGTIGSQASITLTNGTTFTMEIASSDNALSAEVTSDSDDDSGDSSTTPDTTVPLSLDEGWNLIAIPVASNVATEDYFSDALIVWGYADQTWESNPDTLEYGRGYWVKTSSSQQVDFSGESYATTLSNLSSGWNLLGAGQEMAVSEFSGVSGVWVYEQETWYSLSEISTITVGQGFWVNP